MKNTRDIWGGSKLTNFRAMARMAGIGATLSRYGSSARLHCSFVELTPTQPAWCKWALNLCTLLIWLTMLTPPKSQGWPGLLLVASPCKQLASACATDSQRFTNLTQAAASLSMVAPAKWPQTQHKLQLTLACTKAPPKRLQTNPPVANFQ